jgi:hypothetical protein
MIYYNFGALLYLLTLIIGSQKAFRDCTSEQVYRKISKNFNKSLAMGYIFVFFVNFIHAVMMLIYYCRGYLNS